MSQKKAAALFASSGLLTAIVVTQGARPHRGLAWAMYCCHVAVVGVLGARLLRSVRRAGGASGAS